MIHIRSCVVAIACMLSAASAAAQAPTSAWAAVMANDYQVTPGITYLTASNWEAKLDVYTPRGAGPHPTVLHIHGGGWTGGSRESVILRAMPFLEMGFAVVNVSYRLARVAEAPAAVEDCLCALRWVIRNAKALQLRHQPHRRDRVFGGRPPGADHRHDSGVGRTGSAMPGT